MLGPCVPTLEIHAAQGARNLGILLRGIRHFKGAEQVIHLNQAEEQAEVARACRVGRFEQARVAARKLRAIHAANALGSSRALRARIVVGSVVFFLPRSVVVAPDVTALVMAHIAAGHAVQRQLVGCCLSTHRTATRNAGGFAIANGGDKVLHQRCQRAVGAYQALENGSVVGKHACHIARGNAASVAARLNLANDIREVVRVRILDVAALDLAHEVTGVTHRIGRAPGIGRTVTQIAFGKACLSRQHGKAACAAVDVGMFDR